MPVAEITARGGQRREVMPGAEVLDLRPAGRRGLVVRFLQGLTPTSTGAQVGAVRLPYDPGGGATRRLAFRVKRLDWRVEVQGSSAGKLTFQRSAGGGMFNAETVGYLTIPASSNEAEPVFVENVVVYSGDVMRVHVDTIGTGMEQWTAEAVLEEL